MHSLTRQSPCWIQLACWLLLGLISQPLAARELQLDEDQLTRVELATMLLTQGGQPVVLLSEPGSQARVPIFIGPQEARSISDALQDSLPLRPMTHDLINQVFFSLNAQLKRILIDDLQEGAYLAFLEVQLPHEEQPLLIDARPSDAMALALRAGASIYAGPEVMKAATLLDSESLDQPQIQALGISVGEASEDLRQALNLPTKPGVLVTASQNPAKELGLPPGALITTINGQPPRTPMEFLQLIRQTPSGQQATLGFWYDDKAQELTLEVGFKRSQPPRPPTQVPSDL